MTYSRRHTPSLYGSVAEGLGLVQCGYTSRHMRDGGSVKGERGGHYTLAEHCYYHTMLSSYTVKDAEDEYFGDKELKALMNYVVLSRWLQDSESLTSHMAWEIGILKWSLFIPIDTTALSLKFHCPFMDIERNKQTN